MASRTHSDDPNDAHRSQERALHAFYTKNKEREEAETRALDDFYERNRDSERGIQNVSARSGYSETPPEAVLKKTVERQFREEKGVAARAEKKRWGQKQGVNQGEGGSESRMYENSARAQNPAEVLRTRLRETALRRASAHTSVRAIQKLSSRARWWVIGIVAALSLWQFLFALVSLGGFAAHAVILQTQKETWIGKFVGSFVDYSKYFPGEYIGLAAWGIATIIAVCTFLGLVLWYRIIGIRIFDNIMTTSITIVCLSLSILPVTNLFAPLLLWSLYMNTQPLRPLFSP